MVYKEPIQFVNPNPVRVNPKGKVVGQDRARRARNKKPGLAKKKPAPTIDWGITITPPDRTLQRKR